MLAHPDTRALTASSTHVFPVAVIASELRGIAEDRVVFGLARGGVPVAAEVARALGAPLDVLVVRKIGAPGNPEYGIGAIAEDDVRVLNQQDVVRLLGSVEELESAVARARAEIDAGVRRYRGGRSPIDVRGRSVIVVDDGLATGGYFGASTGAGAALWAAAKLGEEIRAVVSRGGRPDLAAKRLRDVRAPVLLIVGGHDEVVLELNRDAQRHLRAPSELSIVPGATHLFEEPGALEEVSRLAGDWFERHLTRL